MSQTPLLFLVGMPAAGKSTVGHLLAQHLGYAFADTDALIEEKLQMSVKEIFNKLGEPFFREQEHLLLADLLQFNSPTVVATGGGFPCFTNNMEHLLRMGAVVFLEADLPLLQQRLAQKSQDRPLLANENSPAERLQKLWEARIEVYKRAHFSVKVREDMLPQAIAAAIQNQITH